MLSGLKLQQRWKSRFLQYNSLMLSLLVNLQDGVSSYLDLQNYCSNVQRGDANLLSLLKLLAEEASVEELESVPASNIFHEDENNTIYKKTLVFQKSNAKELFLVLRKATPPTKVGMLLIDGPWE